MASEPEEPGELAWSRYWDAVALEEEGRYEQALAAYDRLLSVFEADDADTDLRICVASSLVRKAGTLRNLDRDAEALAADDCVIAMFADDEDVEILEQVASAFLGRGRSLQRLEGSDEALRAFEEVSHRFGYTTDAGLRERVAASFYFWGTTLADDLGRYEDACAVFDAMLAEYSDDVDVATRAHVASVLVEKADALTKLQRRAAAVELYEHVAALFGDAGDVELEGPVAKALERRAQLVSEGDPEAALRLLDDLVARYANAASPEARDWVVVGLLEKIGVLSDLARADELLTTADDFLRTEVTSERFGSVSAAAALLSKGVALGMLKRRGEALAVFDDVLQRFRGEAGRELQHAVACALYYKAHTLRAQWHIVAAVRVFYDLACTFWDAPEPEIRKIARGHKPWTRA